MVPCEPPPPPPPPVATRSSIPTLPTVAVTAPPGSFLIELLVYNGAPFADHWAYFVRSNKDPNIGVLVEAAGNPLTGFWIEIKRGHNITPGGDNDVPTKRVPLQWLGQEHVDEMVLEDTAVFEQGQRPACSLEQSLLKTKAPEKSLRPVQDRVQSAPVRLLQRNCQTWIVESADQLVADGILHSDVAEYLHAIHK
ncbi:hypothetical protein BJY04DRAFT_188554 [Aspergillus karnatakaensis]|uniref:uncharacterized protein n=1 Tax=Aspergillus karnatakaensis TaxID=1810916 RepID=UPI003CCCCDEE